MYQLDRQEQTDVLYTVTIDSTEMAYARLPGCLDIFTIFCVVSNQQNINAVVDNAWQGIC